MKNIVVEELVAIEVMPGEAVQALTPMGLPLRREERVKSVSDPPHQTISQVSQLSDLELERPKIEFQM